MRPILHYRILCDEASRSYAPLTNPMKPYSEYSAEELAMERLFIRWVMHPDDPPIRKFWMGWIAKYPHMREVVQDARKLVKTASDWNLEEVSAQESGSLWSRIRTTLETLPERDRLNPSDKAVTPARWYFLRWSVGIAATVALLLFLFLREPAPFSVQSEEASIAKSDTISQYDSRDSTSKPAFLKIK